MGKIKAVCRTLDSQA